MKFDVFLSHNSKDKPVVEQIAHKLEAQGLKVWLDKWNLIPGDPWQEDLEEALDESQTIAVFVGPHDISPWENEEMRSAIEERVQDKKRRVIPVLLPGAPDNKALKLPRFLKRLTWVDFRTGINDEDAFHRLVSGIKGVSPGKSSETESAIPLKDELPPVGDLPIGSRISFTSNPNFEGRLEQLKKLGKALLHDSDAGVVINQAIVGMGGLGKTQLAVEFAYRYGRFFRGVHWLDLADPSLLDSEIAQCGMQMSLPNFPADQPSQVVLTVNTWKEDGPRLLVLDNFEAVDQVNKVISRLRHSNLRLLVTSRRTDWTPASGLQPLPLELFAPEESLDFLKKSLDDRKEPDQEADLKSLGERLGHLPLALELASRYLNGHPRLKIPEYLTHIKSALEHPSMQDWRNDLHAPTEHDLNLLNTFAISWNAVKNESAQKVFLTAGFLAPNSPIPLEILEKSCGIDSNTCDEALDILYGLGLLRNSDNDLPLIHPLLAEYGRGLAKENKEILEKLADTLGILSNKSNQMGLPSEFIPLRSHLSTLAENAEKEGSKDAGILWNNYGYHLKMIADNFGAKAAYMSALKIDEIAYGLDHPEVAVRVNNLGAVLQDIGDLPGAKAAFERALKIRKEKLGDDHLDTATTFNDLGNLYRVEGNFDEARNYLEKALHVYEKVLGRDHPWVASAVNNLGLVMKDLGDLLKAKAAYERALKIWEANLGADHPQVAIGVNNLGSVLQELEDLPSAKVAYERALKIDEATYGPNHPNVARDINNLGSVQKALGDLPAAKAAYERALKIDEATYGPNHPAVARDINNLGSVLQVLGDLLGAKAAFERALKIDEATYGPNHPIVAIRVNNLGSVQKALGDLAGAKAAYGRALATLKNFLPPDHPNIKTVQGNLDSLK